jgi:hypothetical protein
MKMKRLIYSLTILLLVSPQWARSEEEIRRHDASSELVQRLKLSGTVQGAAVLVWLDESEWKKLGVNHVQVVFRDKSGGTIASVTTPLYEYFYARPVSPGISKETKRFGFRLTAEPSVVTSLELRWASGTAARPREECVPLYPLLNKEEGEQSSAYRSQPRDARLQTNGER